MRPVVRKGYMIFFLGIVLVTLASTSSIRCFATGDRPGAGTGSRQDTQRTGGGLDTADKKERGTAPDSAGKNSDRIKTFPGRKERAARRVPWLALHLVFHALGKSTGQPVEKDGKEVFEISTKGGLVQIA